MRCANRAESCSVSDCDDAFINMVWRNLSCIGARGSTDPRLIRPTVLVVYWARRYSGPHDNARPAMKLNDLQHTQWVLARRAERMNPSVIREILKVTERPGIISFAGGLPSPKTFPIQAFRDACDAVLDTDGRGALQYAASEGYAPL